MDRCSPTRYFAERASSLVILGAVGTALWAAHRPTVSDSVVSSEQLTSNSAEAPVSQAALSPDGTQLAYVDTRGLLLMQVKNRQERLLLDGRQVDWFSCLAWYQDGKRLLARRKEDKGQTRFMMIDIASGQASEFGPADSWLCGIPSPDGSRVAYTRWMPEERVELGVFEVPDSERRRALFVSGPEERVFSTVNWSRDGRLIAFGSYVGRVDARDVRLQVMDPLTGESRTVVKDRRLYQQSYTAGFTWISDRSLVYALAPPDPFRNREELRVLTLPRSPFDPAYSVGEGAPFAVMEGSVIGSLTSDLAGRRLAYIRYAKQADIWVGRFRAGESTLGDVRRLTLSERNEWPSDWDAEGRHVLLVAEGRDGYVASRVPENGGVVTPIAALDGWSTWPIQSTGGVLFWHVDPNVGGESVSLMATQGERAPSRLLSVPQSGPAEGTGRPPPREAWVRCALEANRCIVARQELGAGIVMHELLPDGGLRRLGRAIDVPWTRGIGLAPDGERVAVVDQPRRRVLVCSTAGEVLEDLRPAHGTVQFAAWTPDARGLVVSITDPRGNSLELWRQDGVRTELWTSDWAWLTHPVVSRDGQRLAFAVTPFHGNVWSLQH